MNVVDSCGWLEYFANEGNADFFAPIIEQTSLLIVPAITVFEVCKRLMVVLNEEAALKALTFMKKGRIEQLDAPSMLAASVFSFRHKVAMADAIIWQTAQDHKAKLYTQDVDLKGLPNVIYQAKLPLLS